MPDVKIKLQNMKTFAKYKDNTKKEKKWYNEKLYAQCIKLKELLTIHKFCVGMGRDYVRE